MPVIRIGEASNPGPPISSLDMEDDLWCGEQDGEVGLPSLVDDVFEADCWDEPVCDDIRGSGDCPLSLDDNVHCSGQPICGGRFAPSKFFAGQTLCDVFKYAEQCLGDY